MEEDRDLEWEGTKDRTKGKTNQGWGQVEEQMGRADDDEEMEERGMKRQGKDDLQEDEALEDEDLDDFLGR
jgi:uncharacterized protein YjbJ (UPF0337 family)